MFGKWRQVFLDAVFFTAQSLLKAWRVHRNVERTLNQAHGGGGGCNAFSPIELNFFFCGTQLLFRESTSSFEEITRPNIIPPSAILVLSISILAFFILSRLFFFLGKSFRLRKIPHFGPNLVLKPNFCHLLDSLSLDVLAKNLHIFRVRIFRVPKV